MSEELVDLGHNGNESLRVDGLVNVLTGMGSSRDKSQYTTSTPIVFLTQEEIEIAKKLLAQNCDINIISVVTGLSHEQIKKLKM